MSRSYKSLLSAAVFLALALGAAVQAWADIVVVTGVNNQGTENVLLNVATNVTTATGTVGANNLVVNFTSSSGSGLLSANPNGQPAVSGGTGNTALTQLTMSLASNATFTRAVFNINAAVSGSVLIHVEGVNITGGFFEDDFTVDAASQNFFTITAINGQLITSVSLTAINGAVFGDVRQTRLGGGAIVSSTCAITCPAAVVTSNDTNQCGAVVSYAAPTTAGTCGTITCTPAAGSFFPVVAGGTNVTCAESLVGGGVGATCSFSVTVNDTQPPSLSQPPNVTVSLVENQTQTPVSFAAPVVGDNCPGVTVAATPPSGSAFPPGSTTVTVTATDASGNMTSATFLVQVLAFLKVPTMSEAALIVLALLLMGIVALRRSRQI